MATFTLAQWTVMVVIASGGVLAMLHAVATRIRNDVQCLEHLAECKRLRSNYLKSARQRKSGGDESSVEIIEVDEVGA